MPKRLECTIYGKVHGVFYREAIFQHACDLSLTGFVQNEPNGTVRVVAEGEESVLKEFLPFLHAGSAFSKVERVEEAWPPATGEFKDFRIRFRNFFGQL